MFFDRNGRVGIPVHTLCRSTAARTTSFFLIWQQVIVVAFARLVVRVKCVTFLWFVLYPATSLFFSFLNYFSSLVSTGVLCVECAPSCMLWRHQLPGCLNFILAQEGSRKDLEARAVVVVEGQALRLGALKSEEGVSTRYRTRHLLSTSYFGRRGSFLILSLG